MGEVTKKHPISGVELRNLILDGQRNGNVASPRLVILMMKLVENISKMYHYNNPDDRDDVIAHGIMVVYQNWHKFDIKITTNAFAFLTSTARNGIFEGWNIINKGRISVSYSNICEEQL